ncbi:hypothetical protein GGI21_006053, partial [Coemansia aciculifera]
MDEEKNVFVFVGGDNKSNVLYQISFKECVYVTPALTFIKTYMQYESLNQNWNGYTPLLIMDGEEYAADEQLPEAITKGKSV